MRRAALIFFHMAAGVSLLLCVAAVGLWWWGRTAGLQVSRVMPHAIYYWGASRGEIGMSACDKPTSIDRYPDRMLGWKSETYPDTDLVAHARTTFPDDHPAVAGVFVAHTGDPARRITFILLPLWFVVLLFALLPLAAGARLARRRRRARLAAGCCIACGYDLRESPQRCPECGRTNSGQ